MTMDPFTIAGGVTSAASGIMNFIANQTAADRAAMLQDKSMQEWMKLAIPDPEQQKLALQKFVVEGVLDPKIENAIKANPSQFEKIATNTQHQAAQNRALGELENIGYEGGLRLQDKAALQDAMLEGQVRDRAQRDNINAEMARRGLGGSGFDVAAKLQGQQASGDRDANNSLKVAAMAQDRALKSIEGAGDLAGKYRGQDFSEQSAKASAADKINMFNTQNLQDVQQRNVGSLNQAAAQNLAQKQKVSDQNVQQSNYEQEYNKKLVQQQFENQLKKTAGLTGQYGNQAQAAQQQGQNLGNFYTNMGSGVSGALAVGANQWNMSKIDDYFDQQKKKSKEEK